MRAGRSLVTVGALGTAFLALGAAPAAAQAESQSLSISTSDRNARFGQVVEVRGQAPAQVGGRDGTLQFRPRGGTWRRVKSVVIPADGRYAVRTIARRSGALRVFVPPAAGGAASGGGGAEAQTSAPRAVDVSARIVTATRRLDVLAGRGAKVTGRLTPAVPGRTVALQQRSGGGWRTIARATTSSSGRYVLRHTPRRMGTATVRVRFGGDQVNRAAGRSAGRLNVYRRSHASWYGPGFYGRQTGCGPRLRTGQLGVAHKRLPCGTMVTFRHKGRSVRVPVIDRGPYIAGREWDLTAATARRLGFSGHGPVWSTR
jgi:rare lipoprotein A